MHLGETIVHQGIDIAVGNGKDTAALATVTAVRPAEWTEFFTTERRNAVATIAGNDFNLCFVYKLHNMSPKNAAKK
jgi:hypothetical protein